MWQEYSEGCRRAELPRSKSRNFRYYWISSATVVDIIVVLYLHRVHRSLEDTVGIPRVIKRVLAICTYREVTGYVAIVNMAMVQTTGKLGNVQQQ